MLSAKESMSGNARASPAVAYLSTGLMIHMPKVGSVNLKRSQALKFGLPASDASLLLLLSCSCTSTVAGLEAASASLTASGFAPFESTPFSVCLPAGRLMIPLASDTPKMGISWLSNSAELPFKSAAVKSARQSNHASVKKLYIDTNAFHMKALY